MDKNKKKISKINTMLTELPNSDKKEKLEELSKKISARMKKEPAAKQLVAQISMPANQGFQEKIDKILSDPENYRIENSIFKLNTKSSIFSQAVALGLDYMINHPKKAPTNAETNLFAQAVADSLFPLIDARLKTLFECTISNYINNKSTNLYTKNIMLALASKFGSDICKVSINKLDSEINKNIDFIIEDEQKLLMKALENKKEENKK